MSRPAALLAAFALSLVHARQCGREASTGAARPLAATHGGQVAASGGVVAEVAAEPDGRVAAYVRDARGAPVVAHDVRVTMRDPSGRAVPVATRYDAARGAHVGRVAGLPAGAYRAEVEVRPTAASRPLRVIAPDVQIAAPARLPAPRHGGRVQTLGDHAVEVVAAQNGDVAMFWMDADGNEVPVADVAAPSVELRVDGDVHVVPTRVAGPALVARAPAAPRGRVAVVVPSVVVRGVRYHHVAAPDVVVVAALPPVVVVAAPAVVVARPAAPAVILVPGRWHGHGHGHGHILWRGRGRGHWRAW